MNVRRRLLAWLLWLANSRPPMSRTEFYAMKDAILRKHATPDGHDLQRIVAECYGDRWRDEGDVVYGPCGPTCRRCGGTGIYETKYFLLTRWRMGRYVFHSNPTRINGETGGYGKVTIEGRVAHADTGRNSDEAFLWLALLTGRWSLLWKECAHVWRYGRGTRPLLNLACLCWFIAQLHDRTKANECYCGRRWRHWFDSRGWCVCRKCRQPGAEQIPF